MAVNTLEDVLYIVQQADNVIERDRKQMASAIRRLCEIRRTSPEKVAAKIEIVRDMASNPPPHHVMMPGSWSNLKSRVKKALYIAGIGDHRKRLFQDLSPAWQEIRLQTRGLNFHAPLSALSHYCSERGIDPKDVDQSTFNDFETYLLETRVRSKPENAYSHAVIAWNKAVDEVPDWPRTKIFRAPKTNHFSFPLSDYTTEFQADFEAKFERISNPNIFDLSTPAKALSPATIKHVKGCVLRFAAACRYSGTDKEALKGLSDLLEIDRFTAALKWLLFDRAKWAHGDPVPDALIELTRVIRTHGYHWLRHDIENIAETDRDKALHRIDDQREKLKGIAQNLGSRERGITAKNRDFLGSFDDLSNLVGFLNLPEVLWNRARRAERPDRKAALTMQSAIAIRILQEDPIRLKNLVELDWKENFRAASPRRGSPVRLVLSRKATKNKVDHNDPLPDELIRWLEVYMKTYQPFLASEPSNYVFPGRKGGTKHVHSVREQIKNTVKRETGLEITPHQFRHLAVKLAMDANPRDHEAPTDILRHKDSNTVRIAYKDIGQSHALAGYQDHLQDFRVKENRRKSRNARSSYV